MIDKLRSKVSKLWKRLEHDKWPEFILCYLSACIIMVGIMAAVNGCRKEPLSPRQSNPAPVICPAPTPRGVPDLLILRPGQSAMLMEDIVVTARIPYQGNELYVGKVRLMKGTLVAAPVVER